MKTHPIKDMLDWSDRYMMVVGVLGYGCGLLPLLWALVHLIVPNSPGDFLDGPASLAWLGHALHNIGLWALVLHIALLARYDRPRLMVEAAIAVSVTLLVALLACSQARSGVRWPGALIWAALNYLGWAAYREVIAVRERARVAQPFVNPFDLPC